MVLRSLAIDAAVGLGVGLVVGGTLGRVFMRLVFLAKHDTLGFRTAMGATGGEFTGGGTAVIHGFGAIAGVSRRRLHSRATIIDRNSYGNDPADRPG